MSERVGGTPVGGGVGAGDGAHPSDDELADAAAGVLEGPRGDEVDAHVAGCARCSAVRGEAAAAGELLADAGLADRAVDAALERVRAGTDGTGPHAAPADDGDPPRTGRAASVLPAAGGSGRGPGGGADGRRAPQLPGFALAAALVLLAGLGGVLLLGVLSGVDDGAESADTTAAAEDAAGDDVGSAAEAAVGPVLLESGVAYDEDLLREAADDLAAGQAPAGATDLDGGPDAAADPEAPTGEQDGGDGPAARTEEAAPSAAAGEDAADLGALDPLRDPEALRACLDELDPERDALAVDYAVYEGEPAVVVVFGGREPGGLDVVVVGPACGDELRLFLRVPPG